MNAPVTLPPVKVSYNDWSQVEVPALKDFVPTYPLSVVMPYYQTPTKTLATTLASLERQSYPRDLFEVIIVDDGSRPPLQPPRSVLNVKVVRQERCGYGLWRARNTGAAIAHDILLFLDSDMIVEEDWMRTHARWHHTVSDALTVGIRRYVDMQGINPETVRHRGGTLKALLSGRPFDPPRWTEIYLARSNELQSRADDFFFIFVGGNFGIRKQFYETIGRCTAFAHWGGEDIELAYRAYTYGALFVPIDDGLAWHQGRWAEGRETKRRDREIERGKHAHLIAHPKARPNRQGRAYSVPRCVVTIDARNATTTQVIETAEHILADRCHDLIVRIETSPSHDEQDGEILECLRYEFDPDPRVIVCTPVSDQQSLERCYSALDDFPTAAFHISLSARLSFSNDLVHRLQSKLGDAVCLTARFSNGIFQSGTGISITRTWALHRARRTGAPVAHFGEAKNLKASKLGIKIVGSDRSAFGVRYIRGIWLHAKHLAGVVRRRSRSRTMRVMD